ncbi:MAG: asparagine synthase (glutamine-hydrolyzing), partial [Propionibacteriaceae bacterium]|nr:asparagine synthase (glutamine-hydrolyzing) [Propionibacteriaceae bacterium]
FVIWDTETQTAFGARDWFGIKPLYLAETGDGFGFASEAKSLRALTGPAVVDTDALRHYLVLQYVPEPESADAHLRRIESGTSFTLRDGVLTAKRYFRPRFAPTKVNGPEAEAELYAQILEVLDDSVAKHMRADVTVGSFLSGGIDSTAIAALAKKYNPNLLTFTTGFEREGYSEVDVAAESAEAIGVKHYVKTVSETELCETLPLIVWYLDDPVADPALVPLYFVAREARKHVKVVLSGEGADELFGGYNIYREPLSLRPLTALPNPLRKGLAAVSRVLPQGFRGKSLLERGSIDLEQRYYGNARNFRESQLQAVLRDYTPSSFREITDPIYELSRGWDPVARMQHLDLFTWLRGDILVKADKVTMANSLELRVPFLDKEVFEVARHIPISQKITRNQSKVAMRKALEPVVPAHVLNRKKLGFPVPIRVYLRDDYGYEWARSIIESAGTTEFIDPLAALEMLDAHRRGDADNSRQIWTLLVFMLWYDIFVTEQVKPEVPHPQYPVHL